MAPSKHPCLSQTRKTHIKVGKRELNEMCKGGLSTIILIFRIKHMVSCSSEVLHYYVEMGHLVFLYLPKILCFFQQSLKFGSLLMSQRNCTLNSKKNIITLFYTFAEKIFEMLHICDNFFLLQICYAPTNDDNGNSNSDYGQVKLGQAPMGANLYICDKNVNF